MFREMRRKNQALPAAEAEEVLLRGTSGVLALEGDDHYPYAVPISYVYHQGKLYFHSAQSGHKIDAMTRNTKASFCVIDKNEIIPQKYTTYFRSAIAFGRIRVLEAEEKRQALETLAMKYSADFADGIAKEIDAKIKHLCVFVLEIEHLSGKEAIELVQKKR